MDSYPGYKSPWSYCPTGLACHDFWPPALVLLASQYGQEAWKPCKANSSSTFFETFTCTCNQILSHTSVLTRQNLRDKRQKNERFQYRRTYITLDTNIDTLLCSDCRKHPAILNRTHSYLNPVDSEIKPHHLSQPHLLQSWRRQRNQSTALK